MISNNICNTKLSLSLGDCENDEKYKFSVIKSDDYLFPSLTLGFSSVKPDDVKGGGDSGNNNMNGGGQASSVTGVSSFSNNSSVKREREVSFEEAEVEKVLSPLKVGTGNEDQDEEGPRKKLRLTKEQSLILEDSFKEHSTLNPKQKQALAKRLNLRPRQVEVWFQNRRARTKLKQTEMDNEVLKKWCETLKEENRRLHKEIQEMKGPLYMQLPAATLSMCPSCESITGGGGGDNSSKISFSIGAKPHFYDNSPAAC